MAELGTAESTCQVCGATNLRSFYEQTDLPVQTTVLLETEEEAKGFRTGALRLGFCQSCGFIQNQLFEPHLIDYSLPTEESQAFSQVFADYASRLADRLVDEFQLRGGQVLEVGSGKGEFLALLAKRGIRRGVGIDPGFLPERAPDTDGVLEFRREFFCPDRSELTGDLVVARHLVEHVSDVLDFLRLLRSSVSATRDSALFVEVPDTSRILREGAFWDVYYEHCSYFTRDSLATALHLAQMPPMRVELGFDDQYILAWARPSDNGLSGDRREYVEALAVAVDQFSSGSKEALDGWRSRIAEEFRRGAETVIWGASSKTVSFLAALGVTDVAVVDINPFKQGKWLPGIGLEVRAPGSLAGTSPGLIVAMNSVYEDEIRADAKKLGLAAEVVSIGDRF